MNFRTLCALLLVYRANFQVMHWFAKGRSFDRIHKLTNDYYDKCLDAADKVAELGLRIDQRPPGYQEALEIVDKQEDEVLVLDSNSDIDYNSFVTYTDRMLNDIVSAIELLLDQPNMKDKCNVGIKADLESLHNEFDHEARFLNTRRNESAFVDINFK